MDEWNGLKCVYRIPKRAHVELIQPPIDEEDILEEEQVDTTSKKITTISSNKKKKKRTRYESTREFFDPDNDYFEYISIEATQEEITLKMQYPPQSSIPTAPKAMLDSTTSTTVYQPSHYHQHHQKQYYNSKHKKHTSTGGYFSYNTVNNNNISSFNSSTSVPITPVDTTITTLTTNIDTQTESQQQQQFYTEYYQDPYNYSQFYYEAAAAAEGMTVQEYYYAFQQQTNNLPLNWQMAVTDEGSAYYYNISTQQTQWEIPIEDQPQQISIEGVADPLQLEELVEQAILDSEEIKRKRLLLDDHSSTDSPKDENHHLLTPTSGSMDENSPFLNDVDLKREVGKVVTKYLSSKQQALWKGDKHLFKDLARKVNMSFFYTHTLANTYA